MHRGVHSIGTLKASLDQDLRQCHTQLEIDCCKAVGGLEIRETAQAIAATRALTPGELAIAREFGYCGLAERDALDKALRQDLPEQSAQTVSSASC